MIIRKPYAMLIKYFKLIHAILFVAMSYLMYRTGMITTFFSKYFSEGENVIGQEITNGLFHNLMYFSIILIIVGFAIILSLMFSKNKEIRYYVIGIVIYILLLVVFQVDYNIINQMEGEQLSTRTVKAISDITTIAILIQGVFTVLTFVRATGFNIKKFDFDKDLQELDITESDREEVEIGLEFDYEKLKRNVRKSIRHFKYGYLENKIWWNIVIFVFLLFVGYQTYMMMGWNEKKYKNNEYFSTSDFTMNIENSYITNTDYKQNELPDGKHLLVLQFKIRKNYTTKMKLETSRAELLVGDLKYYPTGRYQTDLKDFGTMYRGQNLLNEEEYYYLCYEIPSNYLDKKIRFRYIDRFDTIKEKIEAHYITVNLNNIDLRTKKKVIEHKLGEKVEFNHSILKNGSLIISDYDLKKEYKLQYNFCPTEGECYQSFEYIKPSILTNYNKTLLKLNISFDMNNPYFKKDSTNVFQFLNTYGKIKYVINGNEKIQNIDFKQVKPVKANSSHVVYLEVLEEIMQADKISFILKIRNQEFIYILK